MQREICIAHYHQRYANPLMDVLDPQGYCTSRLFREACTFRP